MLIEMIIIGLAILECQIMAKILFAGMINNWFYDHESFIFIFLSFCIISPSLLQLVKI